MPQAIIDQLALDAKLKRPYPRNDPVHFEPVGPAVGAETAIVGNSPINLLVTDPLGREVGYDPATKTEVNQIGSGVDYSGAGTEPQVIFIPSVAVIPGAYTISGVGTGFGPYTISVRAWAEDDPSELILDHVLSRGSAVLGLAIAPVPPIDLVQDESVIATDTVPPTTMATLSGTLGSYGLYVGPVTVTLSPTDDLSGVATTQYRIDGGSWLTYAGPFSITTDGVHTVEYFSTDNAGNVEATQASIIKDVATNIGVLLLDPTGASVLNVSGNGSLSVSNYGAVVVDSTNPKSVSVSGGANIGAEEFDLASSSSISASGKAVASGTVKTNVPATAAPVLNLPGAPTLPPAPAPVTNGGVVTYRPGFYAKGISIGGNTTAVLAPGTYVFASAGLSVGGSATVTLGSGVYYFQAGGFSVSGSATVTGQGVALDLLPGARAGVVVGGSGSVTITPSPSGAFRGVTIVLDPSITTFQVSGLGALNFDGTVDAPGAAAQLSGNATVSALGAELIARALAISGNAALNLSADAENRVANPNTMTIAGGPTPAAPGPVAIAAAQLKPLVRTAPGERAKAGVGPRAHMRPKHAALRLSAPHGPRNAFVRFPSG